MTARTISPLKIIQNSSVSFFNWNFFYILFHLYKSSESVKICWKINKEGKKPNKKKTVNNIQTRERLEDVLLYYPLLL